MRTLDNLFDDTQDMFNHICEHLMSQGQRSKAAKAGGCAYRGDDGMACAVGAVVPDEYYDKVMEGTGVFYIAKRETVPSWVSRNVRLLEALQIMHDSYSPERWRLQLKQIAEEYKLQCPACIR